MIINTQQSQKISIFFICIYLVVTLFHLSHIGTSFPVPADRNATIEQTFVDDYQPHYFSAGSETNLSQISSLNILVLVKQFFNNEKAINNFFLLKIQKSIQYPPFKSIFIFQKVFRI
jgi:hypothetical protein